MNTNALELRFRKAALRFIELDRKLWNAAPSKRTPLYNAKIAYWQADAQLREEPDGRDAIDRIKQELEAKTGCIFY